MEANKKLAAAGTSVGAPLLVLLHNEDLLRMILRDVSRKTEAFWHALVCRKWLDLSAVCQLAACPRSHAYMDEGTFFREIRGYTNLTSLGLDRRSISCLSGFFLGAACFQFPRLRIVHVAEGAASETDDITGDCVSSFFKNCDRLEAFSFFREAYPVPIHPLAWPDDITCLRHIRTLLMYPLASVPESIGELVSLQNLSLGGNFTDVPSSLSCLTCLTRLAFQFTTFTAFPDVLGSLKSLAVFELGFAGMLSLPPSLSALCGLRKLVVNSFNLEEEPQGLEKLSRLRVLDFSGGHMLRLPAAMLSMDSLVKLELAEWVGIHELPEGWETLKRLRVLLMYQFRRVRFLPASFAELASLEKLELVSFNCLRSFMSVERMQSLRFLHIRDMDELTSIPESIGRSTSLETLMIEGCYNLRVIPPSILELPRLKPGCLERLENLMRRAQEAAEHGYE